MSVEQDKTVDELLQAREAYERRDWVLAFERLQGAENLGPEDFMALATSAYLVGNVDEAIRALQAGYQDKIRSGDSLGAVRFAFWLGLVLNLRGEPAVAGGWIARAQRSCCRDGSPIHRTRPDRHGTCDAGQDHDLFRSGARRTCFAG
jgi:hypothetical protein